MLLLLMLLLLSRSATMAAGGIVGPLNGPGLVAVAFDIDMQDKDFGMGA